MTSLLLVVGCGTTEVDTRPRLTQALLEQASSTLDTAAADHDLPTLLAHLADDVAVSVTFPGHPEMPAMSFTKDSYAAHLRDSWPKTESVVLRRLSTDYEISPDGQTAKATSQFEQTIRMKGSDRDIVSTGSQVSMVRLVDGIVTATRIDVAISFR